ncbi:MAG: hypothetical protein NC177_17745 [Ruminococcus flavefaciens]|nr:hypothetical protein [Ruminococcus flavefaciens]
MEKYSEMPAILYHYCSMQEFIDIISNKQIMLKDLQKYDKFANPDKVFGILNHMLQIKKKEVINNKDIFKTFPIFGMEKMVEKYGNNILPFFYAFVLSSNCNKWYMYQKNATDLCVGIKMDLFKLFGNNKLLYLKKLIMILMN